MGVTLAMADPSGRTERLIESLSNLRAIGAANGQYRADNRGYLPLELTTERRRPRPDGRDAVGWTSSQFGGKNCSAYWYAYSFGSFDVEAADRPLNAYLYPGFTFTAPPPPTRLPSNDPARLNQQARVFRDPADVVGRERYWPQPNDPAISSYDDVGTSYFSQMEWSEQDGIRGGFQDRFNEGCRRLSVDQGVNPSRFLHYVDQIGDIVPYQWNAEFRVDGNHGGVNQGVALFADSHAALVTFRPGRSRDAKINEEYSVWFEDLGRPGTSGPAGAAAAPR